MSESANEKDTDFRKVVADDKKKENNESQANNESNEMGISEVVDENNVNNEYQENSESNKADESGISNEEENQEISEETNPEGKAPEEVKADGRYDTSNKSDNGGLSDNMTKGDPRTVYNVVYSAKGGCGKTAFAIKLASTNFSVFDGNDETKDQTTCLIDLDIIGSTMKSAWYGIHDDKYRDDRLHVNDIPYKDKESKFLGDLSVNGNIGKPVQDINQDPTPEIKDKRINVLFASTKSEDREKYIINPKYNHNPIMSYDAFAHAFAYFLNHNAQMKAMKNRIFDMPPGSDGFADTVFDLIFEMKTKYNEPYRLIDNNCVKNLFYIVTPDSGHITRLKDAILGWMEKRDIPFFDNFIIVFNDIWGQKESFKKFRKDNVDEIKNFLEKEKFSGRVYYTEMPNDTQYSDALMNGDTLENCKYSDFSSMELTGVLDGSCLNLDVFMSQAASC